MQKKKRSFTFTHIGLLALILILVNIISSKFRFQIDATAEKRFSLSSPTKKLLQSIKEPVSIEVYLKGEFPAGFQKLAEGTKLLLQSFQNESKGKVKFIFFNPLEGKNDKEQQELYQKFSDIGIQPVNLKVQSEAADGFSQKIIFPAAKVMFNNKVTSINLLESHLSMSPQEMLNYSESLLEYKFASAIKYLLQPDKKKLAYIVGHGEAIGDNTYDILTTLEKYYKIDTLDLSRNVAISPLYDAAIICKPSIAFDEKDKFKLDQYIMQGGNLLCMIDMLRFSMDSLRAQSTSMAINYDLNLDDLLFKYGVRINSDYIEDIQQCNPIPITVGNIGNQPDIKQLPWLFFPYSISNAKHPIVNNLDAVMFMYASSIDTIAAPNIRKEILLTSSNRSRRLPMPVRVSLSNLKYKPEPELYKEKNIPMAVLLQGKFESVYKNRIDPIFVKIYTDSLHLPYSTQGVKESKIIVVSDGDIFLNDVSSTRGPYECGYYKYTDHLFANKTFILNALEYLSDDFGLLEARNKNLTLRLLDTPKVKKNKLQWQFINIALPAIIVLFFGSAYFFFRRKKYEGKTN